MNIPLRACAIALPLALAACSGGHVTNQAQPAVEVSTAMPVRRTFHTTVAAFGQLAADSRDVLSLSVPQAGEIVTTDVVAGRRVQRHTVLLKLATDPAARSAWLQAKSAFGAARDDLKRTQRLYADRLATNTQLAAARKTFADVQAALDAQAKLGGAHPVTVLTAPADGIVTSLDVQRGQRVAGGAKLVEFAPQAALAAQLGVEPEAAAGLHPGMPVSIRPVYAAPSVRPLDGTVAMVGGAVNPQTHLVDVIATLGGHRQLATGTALSATIVTSNFVAWSIPRNALQSDAQGSYIYQIESGKARRVDVKVLASDGSPIGVEGTLDAHAPVITLGSYELSDGDAVRVALVAAHPAGGTDSR